MIDLHEDVIHRTKLVVFLGGVQDCVSTSGFRCAWQPEQGGCMTSTRATTAKTSGVTNGFSAGARGILIPGLLFAIAGIARGDGFLKPIGGDGGGQFIARCPVGQNLTGVELRGGDDIDAIRPVCVASYGPAEISAPPLTTDSGLVDGGTGPVFPTKKVAPGWYGGPGGSIVPLLCPASMPIVIGMDVAAEGVDTVTVNNIHLYCGQALAAQKAADIPSAVFDAPNHGQWPTPPMGPGQTKEAGSQRYGWQRCPSGTIAVGIHGRGGQFVDSLGLICDLPHLTKNPHPPVALGRVQSSAPPGAPMTICERAKSARERNSPAATSLEAQCKASLPPVALGRVQSTAPGSGTPATVCDAAAAARDRNSPTAAKLAERCRALGGALPDAAPDDAQSLDALAAKGETLTDNDPLATALRDHQPAGHVRRGFHIGMAVAEGQTAWGPGKQKILDVLPAPEQEGFKLAISYALDRNHYADLADIGFSIAKSDAAVSAARNQQPDARSKLGFDIASGIFGDPALGAKGPQFPTLQAVTIRGSLSAPAQRGFDASRTFHQSRPH